MQRALAWRHAAVGIERSEEHGIVPFTGIAPMFVAGPKRDELAADLIRRDPDGPVAPPRGTSDLTGPILRSPSESCQFSVVGCGLNKTV